MEFLLYSYIIPLGALVVVVFLMALESMKMVRENELETYRDLRIREMDHARRMKEMEVEHTRTGKHASM